MENVLKLTMQGAKSAIMQDTVALAKKREIKSSVSLAECYICGKGVSDGYSVTAKSLPHGVVLFCDLHYSLQ